MGPAALPIGLSTLFAVLFGSAIAAIVVILVMRRGFARVSAASCGGCGYAVTGLDRLRCPECGADLREVGIVAPPMRRHVPWPLWLIVWSMLLPFPGLVGSNLVNGVLPRKTTTVYSAVFSQPYSSSHASAIIAMRTPDLAGEFEAMQVAIRPLGSGPPSVLVLDTELRPEPAQSSVAGDGPIDAAGMVAWMRSIGLPATPEVDAEAAEIVGQVRRHAAGSLSMETSKYASIAGNTNTVTTPVVPRFRELAAGFWFLLWLLGVIVIWKRRRGAHRSAHAG